jgi:hypothetical protein
VIQIFVRILCFCLTWNNLYCFTECSSVKQTLNKHGCSNEKIVLKAKWYGLNLSEISIFHCRSMATQWLSMLQEVWSCSWLMHQKQCCCTILTIAVVKHVNKNLEVDPAIIHWGHHYIFVTSYWANFWHCLFSVRRYKTVPEVFCGFISFKQLFSNYTIQKFNEHL